MTFSAELIFTSSLLSLCFSYPSLLIIQVRELEVLTQKGELSGWIDMVEASISRSLGEVFGSRFCVFSWK